MQAIEFKKIPRLDFRANEAFKTLRTNITFCGEHQKVILFTSSIPNEGKTSIVFQLAKSFTEDGKKVLLVDADMRKSVLMGHYRVDRETKGLSHYLTGQEAFQNVTYSTNVKNLNIIFAGPASPNPAELLGNSKFEEMLSTQRENYDYILIDTPPLGSVIDAAIIAMNVDGAVIVVESGMVSYKMVQKVKGQLEKSGCRILGAVLNKVDQESKGYYRGYYNKYYGKYYGYGYGYGYGVGHSASESSNKKENSAENASDKNENSHKKRSRRRN